MNEIGIAPPRGRKVVSREDAERFLTDLAGEAMQLPEGAVMTEGPSTCPACGSTEIMWGCDPDQTSRGQDEIHPLVWHPTAWMADSYLCRDCDAGWIEPDEAETITWVRPYWRV